MQLVEDVIALAKRRRADLQESIGTVPFDHENYGQEIHTLVVQLDKVEYDLSMFMEYRNKFLDQRNRFPM